jgi:hypothetical protein
MASLCPELVVGAIQELQHMMKEYMKKISAMFDNLGMLVTKIT